jgi:hypothetical protein
VGFRARIVAALALGALGAAAAVYMLRPGPETLKGPPGNAFRLSYPHSWQPVAPRRLASMPGHPLAALDRKEGVGSVTITRDLAADTRDGSRLIMQVRNDFLERLADYRLLSARVVRTGAGQIFVYSYLPPDAAAIHTVALVPAGSHSYVLDSVSTSGARDVAEQISSIIRSFKPH